MVGQQVQTAAGLGTIVHWQVTRYDTVRAVVMLANGEFILCGIDQIKAV